MYRCRDPLVGPPVGSLSSPYSHLDKGSVLEAVIFEGVTSKNFWPGPRLRAGLGGPAGGLLVYAKLLDMTPLRYDPLQNTTLIQIQLKP